MVRNGVVVGEGWHERFGQAHAEVNALAAAGPAAQGATLYCSLEPCCHQGKTPPCTEAIVRAGVIHVVTALLDPFPPVAGAGIARLRSQGIAVTAGVCEAEARRLNAPYLKLLTTGRPFVQAKWAMTLDGKMATAAGDSKWISSESSRRWVHDLRGKVDAILVGRGTVMADDPLLTARPPGPRTALRIILDSAASLPVTSRLVRTLQEGPILVVTAAGANPESEKILRGLGCEVLPVEGEDYASRLGPLLDELGRRRCTNLLVEGGATVLGSFCDADALDRIHVFIAPRLLGGHWTQSPVGGRGVDRVLQALPVADMRFETLDVDLLIHGEVAKRKLETRNPKSEN